MPVMHTLESPTGMELWKWDHTVGESVEVNGTRIIGMRPVGHKDYPAMMYKAVQSPLGSIRYEGEEAPDEARRANLESLGFVWGGQSEALKRLHAVEQEIAVLAANRAFNDRKLSPAAQAEARDADASTSKHLADIPALPVKPRGRPKKVAP